MSKENQDRLNQIMNKNTQLDKDRIDVFSAINTDIIDDINKLNNRSNGKITNFLSSLLKDSKDSKDKKEDVDLNSILESDSMTLVTELYKTDRNTLELYRDFDVISTYIPQIKEALNTTVDATMSPDDFTCSLGDFIYYRSGNPPSKLKAFKEYMEITHNIESKFEKIITESTKCGRYYAFIKPYSEYFEEFLKRKKEENFRPVNENYSSLNETYLTSLKEQFEEFNIEIINKKEKITNDKFIDDYIKKFHESVQVQTDFYPSFIKNEDNANEFLSEMYSVPLSESYSDFNSGLKEKQTNVNVRGCIFELISPCNIIPIKYNDTILGYYYIEAEDPLSTLDSELKSSKNPFSNSLKISSKNGDKMEDTQKDKIFSMLANIVIKKIDKKFIEENEEFKKELYSILKYNDNYKKNIKVSFIDKKYIEEIEVPAMFSNTLFLCKLYLSLLLTQVMLIVSRSHDTRYHFIKTGVDRNISNVVNKAIRNIKKRQMNVPQLMTSINSILSNAGSFKDVAIPVNKNGEKPIETEIMSGQDVNIDTNLLELVERLMVNSTDTPSVLLNYVNEADYSRTLVMANAKFARKIVRSQRTYNKILTRVYQKIAEYEVDIFNEAQNNNEDETTNSIEKQETKSKEVNDNKETRELDDNIIANNFYMQLPTPKSLILGVMNDLINGFKDNSSLIAGALLGESNELLALDDENADVARALFMKKLIQYMSPLNWDDMTSLLEEAIQESEKIVQDKKSAKKDTDAIY